MNQPLKGISAFIYINIALIHTRACRLSQVNTAARMETTSEPGRVQLSTSAADLLRRDLPPDLALKPRGTIPIKGKVRYRACWCLPAAGDFAGLRPKARVLFAFLFLRETLLLLDPRHGGKGRLGDPRPRSDILAFPPFTPFLY